MKKIQLLMLSALTVTMLFSCKPTITEEPVDENTDFTVYQLDRAPWYDENPMKTEPKFTAGCDPIRLHFYNWGLDEDSVVTINLP